MVFIIVGIIIVTVIILTLAMAKMSHHSDELDEKLFEEWKLKHQIESTEWDRR